MIIGQTKSFNGDPMPRITVFSLISIIFGVSFLLAGCNLDPADPVQAEPKAEAPQSAQAASPPAPDPGQPFLQRAPNVSSMQLEQPQGRDPMMEQGARFMKIVNENKKRLEENPGDKDALYFLGNANFDIKRFEKAREYYLQYLELDPDHAGVRTDLASTYVQTGERDAALRELNRVLDLNPNHPAALFNLGLILDSDEGDSKKAVEIWERLLDNNPDYERSGEIRQRVEEIKKSS